LLHVVSVTWSWWLLDTEMVLTAGYVAMAMVMLVVATTAPTTVFLSS
jgi:hypothetical protein